MIKGGGGDLWQAWRKLKGVLWPFIMKRDGEAEGGGGWGGGAGGDVIIERPLKVEPLSWERKKLL